MHDQLYIGEIPVDFELYDVQGKFIETGNSTSINVTNLQSGIYLLKVENTIQRVVVE